MSNSEIIAIATGSSKTEKTIFTVCLGYALIQSGHRVLMIDACPGSDELSLFLLGDRGIEIIQSLKPLSTFNGFISAYRENRTVHCKPVSIDRSKIDGHGLVYQTVLSHKYIYGDRFYSPDQSLDYVERTFYREACRALFQSLQNGLAFDYILVDVPNGMNFKSVDLCSLADSYIVVIEPTYSSFHQNSNFVRHIDDSAKEVAKKVVLRGAIVTNSVDNEESFRIALSSELSIGFSDTYPIPSVEESIFMENGKIPYVDAPESTFSRATLSAFTKLFSFVKVKWTDEHISRWNQLVERLEKGTKKEHATSRLATALAGKRFDAFISHASEDKKAFVDPLANALIAKGLRIWYDTFNLEIGDSLRKTIDHGLSRSRYGIVVLSHAFFDKHWTAYELNSLTAREMSADSSKIILPIWHGVNHDDVLRYSPALADKVAISSSILTVEQIAEKLEEVLRRQEAVT